MSVQPAVPDRVEVDRFLQRLRIRRDRLAALAAAEDAAAMARAVDEVGEDLLVADEELRVQTEHLEQSARQLDGLVAAYEELFANAPTAYVQTDADGLVLRVNRRGARLLDLPSTTGRSRTVAGLVRPADRAAVRQVLSRLRAAADRSTAREHSPVEAALVRPDGEVPVVLLARRTADATNLGITVHWEIHERGRAAGVAGPGRRAGENSSAVDGLAGAAAAIAAQPTPEDALAEVVAQAQTLIPHGDAAAAILVRAHGRVVEGPVSGPLAARAVELTLRSEEGPLLSAVRERRPVLVADLGHDPRWPRLVASTGGLEARSVLAIPLIGPRGVVGAAALYACRPAAFDVDDVRLASAFGTHAGALYASTELQANLRAALATREGVGQAVGILMERHRLTPTAAFDRLVAASQCAHSKLREVAQHVVETGEDPEKLIRP